MRTFYFKEKLPPRGAAFDVPAFDIAGAGLTLDDAIAIARPTADREGVVAFIIEDEGKELARWAKVDGEWRPDHA